MTKLRLLIAFLGLAAVLLVAGCGSSVSVPTGSVAVVDGEEITQQQLDAVMARVKKSYATNKQEFPKAGTADYTALQNQAVAYLVQVAEYEKAAEDFDVTISDSEVDKRVASLKQQYFGGDEATFKKQIAAQGYTPATFREEARMQILSEKLYEAITADVKVSDADAKAYYDKNKAQYAVAESREVRHILVKTKALADSIEAQLADGADFATLAKKSSLDTGSAANGGQLTAVKGQLVAPFEKVAFALAVNEISDPVKTQFGYHVIQALGATKKASQRPYAAVKAEIVSQLEQEKQGAAVSEWTTELKKSYEDKISYGKGFEPPSAVTESTATSSTTTG
jgi:foldase protein PrsA